MAVAGLHLTARQYADLAKQATAVGQHKAARELRGAITRHGQNAELTASELYALEPVAPPASRAVVAAAAQLCRESQERERRAPRARDIVMARLGRG